MIFNNIDKKLEALGNNEETKRLADLEKIEFDVMQNLADKIKEDFEKETKDRPRSFTDWLKSKPTDYFKRIELAKGGRIGFASGNGVADSDKEKAALGKRVRELMDEGFDMGEAVKKAMSEGYANGGRIGKGKE
ncbi:hypothetical protein OAM89_00455 [bacterium]|nr:hypothetical protein [bacterium]